MSAMTSRVDHQYQMPEDIVKYPQLKTAIYDVTHSNRQL